MSKANIPTIREFSNILYTAKETAEILKTNVAYVHRLRQSGKLPFIKIGQYKVRKETLENFLKQFEGYDITDPNKIIPLTRETS